MLFKTIAACSLLLLTLPAGAQTNFLRYTGLHLPKDSVAVAGLTDALDDFLGQKEKPNHENTRILPEDLLTTSILVDELKGIERSAQFKDSSFYKCYLMNAVPLGKGDFLVQLSYMTTIYLGSKANIPFLRASFRLIARQTDKGFYFSSPLKSNAAGWNTKTIHNYTFYYKNSLDIAQANAYVATTMRYDQKLGAPTEPRKCYYCAHFPEALQMIGVDYKLDYNGYASISLSARERDTSLVVGCYNGTGELFDPHDLWHARLRKVVSPALINKPVDEGCAFLYGGSWGLSWSQIYQLFMKQIASRRDADWLGFYEKDEDFNNDASKPLMASYMINALIIRQLEKDKGFGAVKTLLSCGQYEKTNDAYFKTLEQLTGINRTNFNERVGKLIRESRKA